MDNGPDIVHLLLFCIALHWDGLWQSLPSHYEINPIIIIIRNFKDFSNKLKIRYRFFNDPNDTGISFQNFDRWEGSTRSQRGSGIASIY